MGDVVAFTGQKNTVFVASYEVPAGAKRRRWTVVSIAPDGTRETELFSARNRAEAEWYCNVRRELGRRDRELDRQISADPFFRLLAGLDADMRRAAMAVLEHCDLRDRRHEG